MTARRPSPGRKMTTWDRVLPRITSWIGSTGRYHLAAIAPAASQNKVWSHDLRTIDSKLSFGGFIGALWPA